MELMIEYQSEKKLPARHVVEEAMTAALVRKCNSCKQPFLKEGGCNKMKCNCGNVQCFVCSQNVMGYDHFDRKTGTMCPMYGDMVELLRSQVASAQEETIKTLLQSRNELTDDDVRVDKDITGDSVPKSKTEPDAGVPFRRGAVDHGIVEQGPQFRPRV